MKRKISAGRCLSITGTLILCTGLVCSGLALISTAAFRAIVAAGVVVHIAALVMALKKNGF